MPTLVTAALPTSRLADKNQDVVFQSLRSEAWKEVAAASIWFICHFVQSSFQGHKDKQEWRHQHGLGLRLRCTGRLGVLKVPAVLTLNLCVPLGKSVSGPKSLDLKRRLCSLLVLFSLQIPQREPASAAVFQELKGRKDLISCGVFWHHHNTVIKAVDNLFSTRTLGFFNSMSIYAHTLSNLFSWIQQLWLGVYHLDFCIHVEIEISTAQ